MFAGDSKSFVEAGILSLRPASPELSEHVQTARSLPRHWGLAIADCQLEDLLCTPSAESAHGVPSSLVFVFAQKTGLEQFFARRVFGNQRF
jgi:hypothetical protein